MKRVITLLFYIVSLVLIYWYKDTIITWLKEDDIPVLLAMGLTALLAFFPVVPYSVVIGAMGYIYGSLGGAFISLVGAWVAAIAMYVLIRFFFRDQGRKRLSRFRKMDKFMAMTDRHPFISMLFARLMPIIPQYVVNTYAAVTAIPLWIYALASLLGKIPSMLVFAFVGQNLTEDWGNLAIVFGAYAMFLLAVLLVYRKLRL